MKYLELKKITDLHAEEIHKAVARVVDSGWYLQGEETRHFEEQYAAYIGTNHCVSCGNGLDALMLMLRAYKQLGKLKDGDEVIVPANTYIATILAISENGLKPILVEPRIDTLQIDAHLLQKAITKRTRAVMLVHLYGRCSWTPLIGKICQERKLLLLEDNAQAHGCQVEASVGSMKRTGSLGHAAAHSFYPGKNLGALGDAGAVTTNDARLAQMVRTLANYGSSEKYVFTQRGRNSRMDELQAAVLSVKLRYLDEENKRRKAIAGYYYSHITNPLVSLPGHDAWSQVNPLYGMFFAQDEALLIHDEPCVYHIFPILCEHRDALMEHLQRLDIGTMIHYPIPPHKQKCYKSWHHKRLPITEQIHAQELSLPCHQAMTQEEVEQVCRAVNAFNI